MTTVLKHEENMRGRQICRRIFELMETFCEWFREFSSKSSINGLKYTAQTNRSFGEKVFWILVLIASITICSKMIYDLWNKWNESPVVVAFNNMETFVQSIPYPAITICSEQKFNPNMLNLELLLKKCTSGKRLSFEESQSVALGSNVCNNFFFLVDDVCDYLNTSSQDVNIVEELIRTRYKYFTQFSSKYEEEPLIAIPVVTKEGLCYTFNRIQLEDVYRNDCFVDFRNYQYKPKTFWNRDDGYNKTADMKTYPRRILGPGRKSGIEILVSAESHIHSNDICFNKVPGLKIALHAPDNIPSFKERFFSVPANKSILAAVTVRMLTTPKELQSLSPANRRCYFSTEHYLQFFKTYTKSNCELECLTNFTLAKCRCVRFSMPRLKETRVCHDFDEVKCYRAAEDEYLAAGSEYIKNHCGCLPPCNSVVYQSEVSQVNLPANFNEYKKGQGTVILAHITIYFKEETFLTAMRSELYGLTEFVSNCGGLLGLFVGVSAISFVEIFYFSIIRVLSNFLRRAKT